jgi:hypothetical protein
VPSAARNGGGVVRVGVTFDGTALGLGTGALTTGAGVRSGGVVPALHPAASSAAGTVIMRNRFMEEGCAGDARVTRVVTGTGQNGAAEIRPVP